MKMTRYLLLYPNPASSTMIVVEFSADIHRVRMINLNGQIVYEKRGIDKLGKRLEIDTSLYPRPENTSSAWRGRTA
jgi:hypothetical protein